jgi:hypothetical protein
MSTPTYKRFAVRDAGRDTIGTGLYEAGFGRANSSTTEGKLERGIATNGITLD